MKSVFEGEEGVAYCEDKGWHFFAGRLAERLGTDTMQRRAAGNYIKARKFVHAARVLMGLQERDIAHNLYRIAVQEMVYRQDYAGAAAIERELGNEEAAKAFNGRASKEAANRGDHWAAARLADEAGLRLEARLYRERAEIEEAPAVL